MENPWRPAFATPWRALLQEGMPHRAVVLYQYIVSGPDTGRTRLCVAWYGSVAAMLGTSPRALKSDLARLESAGLLAVTHDGSTFEAYPIGTWAALAPHNPDARLSIMRLLPRHTHGAALVACLSDLGQTGVTDLQVLENERTRKGSSSTQVEVKPPLGKERKGKQPLQSAPASPGHAPKEGLKTRPKIGRNPTPAAKVVAVTRAYLDICVPARMPKVNTDADGMPSPAIAKTVAKAIKANGAEYDWRGLFTQASRGAHLRGENDRQWRASLAWLCNPTNAAKVESGNYGDTSPPPPPGTRRSYPNFPE